MISIYLLTFSTSLIISIFENVVHNFCCLLACFLVILHAHYILCIAMFMLNKLLILNVEMLKSRIVKL
jgi:hypothetical protein